MAGQGQARVPVGYLQFHDLDHLALDKIISYLDAEDLRRFHQVSKGWKEILEERPLQDVRRQELVHHIRRNKENIRARTVPDTSGFAMVVRSRRERMSAASADLKKSGMSPPVLMECTNLVDTPSFDSSFMSTSTPGSNSFKTPSRFEFQDFQEAEKSLEPGQKLLQCRKCRGPVPSPATPTTSCTTGKQIRATRRLSSQSQFARCKLISKLHDDDQTHADMDSSYLLESPQRRETKKARSLSSIDLSDLSPIEKMVNRLVLLSPEMKRSTSSDSGFGSEPYTLEDTVECPTCRYRFCVNCEECEHPETPCRVFYSFSDDSRDNSTSKESKQKRKSSLRRLARL